MTCGTFSHEMRTVMKMGIFSLRAYKSSSVTCFLIFFREISWEIRRAFCGLFENKRPKSFGTFSVHFL